MSDGSYEFSAWVRHGLGSISEGTTPVQVSIDVGGAGTVEKLVSTYGPGDIASLDPRAVVRTSPRDRTLDFEVNRFPMVELADPAIPWLASPPAGHGRVLPWIVLIVVADRPGVRYSTAAGATTLAIELPANAPEELPDLSDSWAWAHAHGGVSRLLAPRRLAPGRSYHACVVPAFAAGVGAALGTPSTDPGPAWTTATSTITLPVLFGWQFSTGPGGDFASLAGELRPETLDNSVGHRLVDVSDVGWGMPAIPSTTVDVSCVLASRWVPRPASPAVSQIGAAIAAAIDVAAVPVEDPPPLAPPLYGSLATRTSSLSTAPTWQKQLNVDVAARIAAGVGADLVRARQEELVDAAWRGAGDAEAINHVLRLGHLAAEVAQRLGHRHIGMLASDAEVLAIARPAYARTRRPGGTDARRTLAAAITDSAIPNAMLGTSLRRLGRAGGIVARNRIVKTGELVARLDVGAIAAMPIKQLSISATSFERLARATPGRQRLVEATPLAISAAATSWAPRFRTRVSVAVATEVATVATSVHAPRAHLLDLPVLISIDPEQTRAEAFAAAARAHQAYLLKLEELAHPPPLSLGVMGAVRPFAVLRDAIAASWAPANAILPLLASRIEGMSAAAIATFLPVRPTPVLEQPLLPLLHAHAPDHVMTNASSLLNNRVAVARADQDFVRSILVGANDELARELLWRGYPAAFGHTWLRTFWGRIVNGVHTPDIPAIEDWPDGGAPTDAAQLVLLVRGDVLRRYPSSIVYAQEARWQGPHRVLGTGAPLMPVISSQLGPDIALFGFELAIDKARGADSPAGPAGWYFVIAEHPEEPHFGLAVSSVSTPRRWRTVGWNSVTTDDLVGNYLKAEGPLVALHALRQVSLQIGWQCAGVPQACSLRAPRVAQPGTVSC